MKKSILIMSLFAPLSALAFSSLSEQSNYYQNLLANPPNTYTITKSKDFAKGEARPKAVLKGVFYFGGTDTKRDLLSNSYQQMLCKENFSQAYAVYTKVNKTVKCDGNNMAYNFFGQASIKDNGGAKVRTLLEQIYSIIKSNGSEGPIYLHCWYGVHASNTIAQIVQKQFCGISDDTAYSNWDNVDLYNGLGKDDVAKNLQKIANFTAYDDLKITEQEKATVCY